MEGLKEKSKTRKRITVILITLAVIFILTIGGRDAAVEPDMTKAYLVYIDEDYSGTDSWLGIDTYGVKEKPFSDRWYFWIESDYSS